MRLKMRDRKSRRVRKTRRVKGTRRVPAFTLVEVMVTTSLLFLVLSVVYSTTTMAFKYFEREKAELVDKFDPNSYLVSVDRLLGGASSVRVLRGEPGFRVLLLDDVKRTGEETVHQFDKGVLKRVTTWFAWSKDYVVRDGDAFFPERRVTGRTERKTLLRGIASVTIKLLEPGTEAGNYAALAVEFTRDGAAHLTTGKLYPVGGRADLASREPWLLQDAEGEGGR